MSGDKMTKEIWQEISSENAGKLKPDELEKTLKTLALFTIPTPSREDTAALIHKLTPNIKPEKSRRFRDRVPDFSENPVVNLLKLVTPQINIFEKSFWLATFILMIVGVLASPFSPDRVSSLVFVAPLLAAMGTCYAFRGVGDGTNDLERTCPVNQVSLVLARLLLVVSYDIFLGLVASLMLWQWQPGLALGQMIFSWLAPLLFLTGLALILTIRLGALPGSGLTLFVWIAQVILFETQGKNYLFSLPGSLHWIEAKIALAVLGIIFVMYGLFAYRKGKFSGGLGYGA